LVRSSGKAARSFPSRGGNAIAERIWRPSVCRAAPECLCYGNETACPPHRRRNGRLMDRHSAQQDETGRHIPLHDAAGFEGMRRAGKLAAATLDFIAPHVQPGIATSELDRLCEDFMRAGGGVPATIGYK